MSLLFKSQISVLNVSLKHWVDRDLLWESEKPGARNTVYKQTAIIKRLNIAASVHI